MGAQRAQYTEKTRMVGLRLPESQVAVWQSAAASQGISFTLWVAMACESFASFSRAPRPTDVLKAIIKRDVAAGRAKRLAAKLKRTKRGRK